MQDIGFNLILYNLATVDIQTVDITLWTALIQTKLQLNGQCYTFNVSHQFEIQNWHYTIIVCTLQYTHTITLLFKMPLYFIIIIRAILKIHKAVAAVYEWGSN